MADDNQPEKIINIESNVNVGTATGETSVSGTKVSVGSAREVNIHGDTTTPPSFRSVLFVGVLAFLGAVLVNIATSQLPPGLQPYLWLAWPLAAVVTGISIWIAYRQSRTTASTIAFGGSLEQRDRSRMLDKVETFWIRGVLDQSLYQIARIELGLEYDDKAIAHPFDAIVQRPSRLDSSIPAGKPVIEAFDELGGEMLILGAPGAGKTTFLLELARDLIACARKDEKLPIPVVLNLSSWSTKQLPLKEWLVEELKQRYGVSDDVAKVWVARDAILPLLDGLDEVAAAHRSKCVVAINSYRQRDHGLMPMAVCSRVADYEVLTTKLQLQGAVVIQPLSRQQVDDFLERTGHLLAAVRTRLRDDPSLWELMDNPLMLSIVALAYTDKSPTKLRLSGTLEKRRQNLFDDYIEAMLARRSKERWYTRKQTQHWLSWLATQMVQENETVFKSRKLQLRWLPRRQQRRVGQVGELVYWLVFGLVYWLLLSATDRFLRWLFGGPSFEQAIEQDRVAILVLLVLAPLVSRLTFWAPAAESREFSGETDTIDYFSLSEGLLSAVSITLLVTLMLSVMVLVGSSFVALFVYLLNEVSRLIFHTQGISLTYNPLAIWIALILGWSMILSIGMFIVPETTRTTIFRYCLRRNNFLPFNIFSFLDYCVDRIFLRRVGEDYIFIHRLLMEHFASLYTEQPAAPPK